MVHGKSAKNHKQQQHKVSMAQFPAEGNAKCVPRGLGTMLQKPQATKSCTYRKLFTNNWLLNCYHVSDKA